MSDIVIGEKAFFNPKSKCIRNSNWSCTNCGDRKPGIIKQVNEEGVIFHDKFLHEDSTFLEIIS
ncbi:MAG: hypothetical protein CXT73_00240 [Methanobacteriota archaeon]|jgi:hypothetical protein|nr:MAG: hypothetical protein CXT73_00240 [Euryarchaeota archaeon]